MQSYKSGIYSGPLGALSLDTAPTPSYIYPTSLSTLISSLLQFEIALLIVAGAWELRQEGTRGP